MAKENGKKRQNIDMDTDLLKEMVTTAFQGSKVDKLTTEDVYKAVFKNFPNLGSQKKAKLQKLKTCIRTVLSRYECFSKMERAMKGNYWQFNEDVSGDAKRKPASRLPHVIDSSPKTKTKVEESSNNVEKETGVITRRGRRRRKVKKSSVSEIKPPDEEVNESEIKSDQPCETDDVGLKEDSVTGDKGKADSPDQPKSKGEEPEVSSSPAADKPDTPDKPDKPNKLDKPDTPEKLDNPVETASATQPSKNEDSNDEARSLTEDSSKNENAINGVATSSHNIPVADHVSQPITQTSSAPFGHPLSPSASHFAHPPPSSSHFGGQPSPSNHSFGSSSPHAGSFGQLSPSFGPPPNYQYGSYCTPNGQFGLPNSYPAGHFGYSSVPIGMPNNHFGYPSVPSNQFYPSPTHHPFALASPFHPHYPAGHPSNFSPFNATGSLPHSPNNRF